MPRQHPTPRMRYEAEKLKWQLPPQFPRKIPRTDGAGQGPEENESKGVRLAPMVYSHGAQARRCEGGESGGWEFFPWLPRTRKSPAAMPASVPHQNGSWAEITAICRARNTPMKRKLEPKRRKGASAAGSGDQSAGNRHSGLRRRYAPDSAMTAPAKTRIHSRGGMMAQLRMRTESMKLV